MIASQNLNNKLFIIYLFSLVNQEAPIDLT